jgi:hypothetical protein
MRADAEDVSTQETQARARELWAEAVAAKGGRERLHQISSLYIVRIQPGGDRDYHFYAFPDYWFNYTYGGYREDTALTIRNGRRHVTWWLPPSGEPAIPGKGSADDVSESIVAQFTYLMVTRWLEPKPLIERKERLGLKRVDVVEVDANGWLVDYYLDPKTHLPIKVVAPEGEIPRSKGERHKVVQFEDYVLINGVMMPRKVTHSWTSIPRKWQERVSYEINPPYDPQFFEHPPTARTLPESWRAKGATAKRP